MSPRWVRAWSSTWENHWIFQVWRLWNDLIYQATKPLQTWLIWLHFTMGIPANQPVRLPGAFFCLTDTNTWLCSTPIVPLNHWRIMKVFRVFVLSFLYLEWWTCFRSPLGMKIVCHWSFIWFTLALITRLLPNFIWLRADSYVLSGRVHHYHQKPSAMALPTIIATCVHETVWFLMVRKKNMFGQCWELMDHDSRWFTFWKFLTFLSTQQTSNKKYHLCNWTRSTSAMVLLKT